jgi:hypothetical protein
MHRVHDWAVEHQRGIGRGGATLAFTVPFLRTFYCITDPAVLEWVLKTRMTNFVKGEVVRWGADCAHTRCRPGGRVLYHMIGATAGL